jgi:hypothetical protein
MPKSIVFEGQTHTFPDDFTDAEIQQALMGQPSAPKVAQQSQPQSDYLTKTEDAIHGAAQGLGGMALGAGKEVVKQGRNFLSMINPTGNELPEYNPPELNQPGSQAAGASIFKAAELLSPQMATSGLTLAARIPAEAVSTAGVTALQGGDTAESLKAGAVAGFSTAIGGAISKAMSSGGSKIQASTIRPREIDYKDGYKPETLAKIGLKGNLQDGFNQVQGKLTELRNARNALIDPNIKVDLAPAFDSARSQLLQDVKDLKYAGRGKQIVAAFDKLKQDVMSSLPKQAGPTGGSWPGSIAGKGKAQVNTTVPLTNAEDAKESFGILGSWAYGRQDLESSAVEKAANTVYLELKKAVESAVPDAGQLKLLNSQMKELIPVRNAMLSRIPVEDRNRMFSLADITAIVPAAVTGDISKLALLAGTRAQKSLRFGNFLVNNAGSATGAAAGLGKLLNWGLTGMTQER